MKEIFTLLVVIGQVFQVNGDGCNKRIINFTGEADGPCFHGKVLPGGVDTQTDYPNHTTSLSARYMLEGTDSLGNPCHVFVENESDSTMAPGMTKPVIVTDSPWLRERTKGPL